MSNSDASEHTNKCTQLMSIADNTNPVLQNENNSNLSPSNPNLSHNMKDNLQSLLHLSTSLHSSEQEVSNLNPGMMDEERKKFLKEVFESLTVDPTDEMKKIVNILNESAKQGTDVEHCTSTLEKVCDLVCSMDLANLFYYTDGLESLIPLLNHEEPTVKALGASVVAECCQNNPFCQKLSTKDNLFRLLIQNGNDSNNSVRFKALSALSAIIRNNPEGVKQFRKHNGFSMIKSALNSQNERVIKKTTYFISALCETDETTKDDLAASGIIPILVNLTKMSDEEHCPQALVSLMTKHDASIKECIKEGFNQHVDKIFSDESTNEALEEKKKCCLEAQKLMKTCIEK